MKSIEIENGLTIHFLQTEKFKTNVITIVIRNELTRKNAAKNALLAQILKEGCRGFETRFLISKECEDMHGAELDVSIVKKGEEQIIHLFFEVVSNGLIKTADGNSYLERAGQLLHNIVFNPIAADNAFNTDVFFLQKEQLRDTIRARINDKRMYAVERLIEIMCANEPFGVHGYGYEEDLDAITEKNLYSHYKKLISESKIEIGMIGSIDEAYWKYWAKQYFGRRMGAVAAPGHTYSFRAPLELREKKEHIGISSGNLVIGGRCNFQSRGKDFHKLMLFNEILGVGANSKLFKSLREKNSLCYYISSFIYRAKRIIVIQTGIDAGNYSRTFELIKEQLYTIGSGDVTDDELNSAKSSIITNINTISDSPRELMDFYITNALLGDNITLSEIPDIVCDFTKEDIAKCPESVYFDTSYFLT